MFWLLKSRILVWGLPGKTLQNVWWGTKYSASASKGLDKADQRQKRMVQKTPISLAQGPRKHNVKSHHSFNEPRRKLLLTASLVYVMNFRGVSVLCKVVLNSGSEALSKRLVSSYGHWQSHNRGQAQCSDSTQAKVLWLSNTISSRVQNHNKDLLITSILQCCLYHQRSHWQIHSFTYLTR